MDESMFTHINGEKNRVIGTINNKTGNIRLDIFKTRNQNELKIFINNHKNKNNNIITLKKKCFSGGGYREVYGIS